MSGAHTNHDSGYAIEAIDSTDVPVYSMPELPEVAYFPMFVETDDPSCGGKTLDVFNLPLNRVTPGGTFQTNTYSLAGNGSALVVPNNQVVPAYVKTTLPHDVTRAVATSNTTLAKFLVLAKDANDSTRFITQGNGYYSFPINHNYIIGYTYYLSDTIGEVSTTPGTVNQPLFYVMDQKTIQILIGA